MEAVCGWVWIFSGIAHHVIRLFVKLLPDALTPQFNDFVLQCVRISKEKTSKDVSKNFEEF